MMLHDPSTSCYGYSTLMVLVPIAICVYTAVAIYVLGFAFWSRKAVIQHPVDHDRIELEHTFKAFGFLFYGTNANVSHCHSHWLFSVVQCTPVWSGSLLHPKYCGAKTISWWPHLHWQRCSQRCAAVLSNLISIANSSFGLVQSVQGMSFNFISLINDSCHVSMYVSEEPVCSTLSFIVSEIYPLSLRQFKVWE